MLGWPKRDKLAHVFLREYSCKRLKLTQLLGRLGVLLTRAPAGEFSYGLGNTVLGRVVEVVWERRHGSFLRFSEIMKRLLFAPLGMAEAGFFLPDGDPRAACTRAPPQIFTGLAQTLD